MYLQMTEGDAEAASNRRNATYVHMASATTEATLAQLKEQRAGTTELN